MKWPNTRTVTPCFIKPASTEGIREAGSLVGEGLGAHVSCEASLVRIQPSPPRLTLEDKSAGEVNVVRQSCLLLMVNLLLIIYGYLALWNAALRAPREDSSTLSISTRAKAHLVRRGQCFPCSQ